MDWINAIREAVTYIEANLFEDIDSDAVARRVNFSSFHFQRIFGAVVGVTVTEYVRNRKLSLAGREMASGGMRVIDAALKYGYDTPESFAKAFQRFHGVPPSAAQEYAENMRFFNPVSLTVNIKGGFDKSNANPTVLEKLIFKPFGPYRFIGKGVCAAPGSGEVFGALWKEWGKISEPLMNMKEYKVEEEAFGVALLDNKGIEEFQPKMWYTIGFFMKPDTPVPNGYDFRDIPAQYVAEGHMKGEFWDMVFAQHRLLSDAICAQNEYIFSSRYSAFAAEVYIPETDADKDGISRMKYYLSCELNPDNINVEEINMAEIIKTFKTPVPAMRFIGKKYGDEDRVNGFFGAKWGDWFRNGWFDVLKQLGSPEGWDNCIGGVGSRSGKFKYWIGRFTPAGTPVPAGFDYIDYDAGYIGTCRLKGHEDGIYGKEVMCCDRLQADGYEMLGKEFGKEFTCFERYLDCDGTEEDFSTLEEGHMFLDICFFVK